MNRYDEKYEIRLGRTSDIPNIMEFIREEWRPDHILGVNRSFFEHEYLEEDGTVNFILAIKRETGRIEGLIGHVKASHKAEKPDIWGCMWSVRPNNMMMLGTELIRRRPELTGCRYDLGIGMNPNTTLPIFKKHFNRHTWRMNHFYRLGNPKSFQIASLAHPVDVTAVDGCGKVLSFDEPEALWERFFVSKYVDSVPFKDEWYVEHRYFKHPIYSYLVKGIEIDGEIKAIFVTRRQECNGHYVIRIVEYIGDVEYFGETGSYWASLLQDPECEYIDFYNLGFDEAVMNRAGFVSRTEDDTNIIPNYFYPYYCGNIEIWLQSANENTRFVKGDGDQDRPN